MTGGYKYIKVKMNKVAVCSLALAILPFSATLAGPHNDKSVEAALTQKAVALNKILESEEAVKCCNSALAANPNYGPALLARAKAYVSLERTEDALRDLTKAATLKDNRVGALRQRAEIYYALKQYSKVIDDLNISLTERASDGQYSLRAKAYSALNKPALAAKDITSALAEKPHNWRLLEQRSKYYLDARDLNKALADFTELIQMDERSSSELCDAELYLNRARVYELMGKPQLAALDRKRASSVEHKNLKNAPFRLKY